MEDEHVAEIDFEQFYGPAFPNLSEAQEFVRCVGAIPADQSKAKIVLHQAARMLWLGDRIEQVAKGRAPLLIVGGSRDSRGVVCSASYETRKFGVRSAMPIARALRLCPNAMCVPVPFKACLAKSAEIRDLLQKFAPVVETASVDEWYMDLTGTERAGLWVVGVYMVLAGLGALALRRRE